MVTDEPRAQTTAEFHKHTLIFFSSFDSQTQRRHQKNVTDSKPNRSLVSLRHIFGWLMGEEGGRKKKEKKSRRITSSSLTTKARVSTKSISLIRIAAWLASTYTRPTQRYRPLTYIYTHISAFVCVFEYGIFLATSKPVMHRPVTRTALIIKPFGACGRSLINVSTFKTN